MERGHAEVESGKNRARSSTSTTAIAGLARTATLIMSAATVVWWPSPHIKLQGEGRELLKPKRLAGPEQKAMCAMTNTDNDSEPMCAMTNM